MRHREPPRHDFSCEAEGSRRGQAAERYGSAVLRRTLARSLARALGTFNGMKL